MPDIKTHIKQISTGISRALGPDRHPIRRELDRIRKQAKKGADEEKTARALEKLSRRLERSIARRRERIRTVPRLSFPEILPITDKKEEIIEAIRRHPVVIVSGETGSGKTTQIPKFCLAAGRGIDGKIGCTQPRRIAAVTVAARIAEELGQAPGESVGYKIRFQDKTGPDAYVKIMTDGILLAETQSDPRLREYDTLIVDEAHERSLNIDFLLGILKILLTKRRDLKVVITSATIDTEKFAAAFNGAPVIDVSGRTFPVEVRWEEPGDGGGELTHVERAVAAVDDILREPRGGDILVFMPTEQDIRDTMEILAGRKLPGTLVLPLFARLTAADQAKVFSARAARKIIVATNIAETSLTIPGIKYVVDTGLARVSQYNPRTRTTALPVIDISKSSADQRMGRCGRVQNGVCVRLFSEDDYNSRPRFTRPEILRANLAEVILRMIFLKLPDISGFPFLDRPPEKAIKDGLDLLMELGAIAPAPGGDDGEGETPPYLLTQQGERMAAMPLDPRLSRMLIEAKKEGCLSEVAVIVAALSIQDPRERPAEKAAEADRAHSVFGDPLSDFVGLLNIWNRFHQETGSGPGTTGRMKRFCTAGFLSFRRMREWRDIHGQILSILKEHRWLPEGGPKGPRDLSAQRQTKDDKGFTPLYSAVHRSILSGFLSNIALRKEGNLYKAAKDREAMIFPGSGLFGKAGAWVVAAEMVETTRLYARSVANIDPDWIEPLAADRCRRTYRDPHWEKKPGQVAATCQVSLYGLILSADRKVAFGPVAPDEACEIFIREALLTGETRSRFPFIAHNLRLVEGIQEMEDKVRRRDILIGEEDLAAFYAERIPGVYDERTLATRIKKAGGDRWLRMREKDLLRYRPVEKEMALYPDNITLGGRRFSCDYEFSPGSDRDGVTVKIPAAAPGVPAEALDWLVPGLMAEKIAALVKGLPKAYRRQLAPVSSAIDTITAEMPAVGGALLPALGRFIHARFGVRIPPSAWSEAALPEHLRMRIAVTDHRGKTIAAGRNPSILKQTGSAAAGRDAFAAAKTAHEMDGLRSWSLEDLPDTLQVMDGRGNRWTAFPALVPDKKAGDCVHLRLFLDKSLAEKRHREGIRLLCSLMLSKDLKFLKRSLKISGYHVEKAAYARGAQALETGIYEKTVATLFEKNIRTRTDFEALVASGARELIKTGESILASVLAVLDAVHDTRTTLYELENKFVKIGHIQNLTSEIRSDLSALVPPTFVTLYDTHRLPHLVRYVQAMGIRARKGAMEFARDRKWLGQIEPFATALEKLLQSLTPETSDARRETVEAFFWMLEEYKISVFAQEIKTDEPVSAKRLKKKIEEIEALY